jgi:hypothetical protein
MIRRNPRDLSASTQGCGRFERYGSANLFHLIEPSAPSQPVGVEPGMRDKCFQE